MNVFAFYIVMGLAVLVMVLLIVDTIFVLMWFFFGDAVALLQKLFVCLETFLCFSRLSDRAYVSRA